MKKILGIILAITLLLTSANFTVLAASEITTFGITVTGFGPGMKKDDVSITLSDSRLKVSTARWSGTFDDDGKFKDGTNYMLTVLVSAGSAKFSENIKPEDLTYSGIAQATGAKPVGEKKNILQVTFRLTAPKSAETLEKEAAIEAAKHKHCYCGGYIEIGDHTTHETVTYTKWSGDSIKYTNGVAYIYLDEDIEIESSITVGGGKTLYLCLNGHSISAKWRGIRLIDMKVGGTLYLCNCTRSASGKLTKGEEEYGAAIHNNGTVKMYGGVITKNKGGFGGGVYNNANFTLYGGDIYDNEAGYGGGVWNDNEDDKKFIMYEGTIGMNVSGAGGAIYNNTHANLILKGGTIDHNAARYGGGVWNNGGNLEIDGGKILGNTAQYGGGVWNNGDGTFEFKSGNISKNMATNDPNERNGSGGGIWNNETGVINMTGGEITFNEAMLGGGVWSNPNSEFVMSGGVIAENVADSGGGIFVSASDENPVPGKFRMSNNAGVVLNTANYLGGGAYVQGVLEINGEAEVTGSIAGTPDNINIYTEEGGQVKRNATMPTQFVDVEQTSYFLEPVKWALSKGITSGTSDITFSPNDTCNLGQVLTFLWRAAGQPTVKTSPPIADVNPGDYYYMAGYWAQSLGIFDRALYPNTSSNRMGAVYFIWCAAGKPECKVRLRFTDTKDPKYEKYYEAIAWAVDNGITSGTSADTFSPGKSCTRAEIVTFLWRAASKGLI